MIDFMARSESRTGRRSRLLIYVPNSCLLPVFVRPQFSLGQAPLPVLALVDKSENLVARLIPAIYNAAGCLDNKSSGGIIRHPDVSFAFGMRAALRSGECLARV